MPEQVIEHHDVGRVIRIPVDGVPYVQEAVNLSYPATRSLVGGGWIEQVRLDRKAAAALGVGTSAAVMLVDEEGMLKQLPINSMASHLYSPTGFIFGPAVLVGIRFNGIDGDELCSLPSKITVASLTRLAGS